MFRRATVLTLRHCKNHTFRNSKPIQFHHPTFNCLILVRNESSSAGVANLENLTSSVEGLHYSNIEIHENLTPLGESGGGGASKPPVDNAATENASGAANVVDAPASSLSDSVAQATANMTEAGVDNVVGSIPEPPEIPLFTQVEEVVTQLAANGEPTMASLGLGGWWPSGWVQHALEFLHCTVGLPWWGAIALGTVIVRVVLFPIVIKSQQTAARVHNNMPQMQVIQMKMTEARQTGNALMAAKYANDINLFMKEKDINPLKNLAVPLAQAPIFISCFFGLREMANLPVESMKTGGMLWFVDLTVPDPYYLLPLLTSTTLWATLEIGTDTAKLSSGPGGPMMKYVLRAIPIIVFPFTMNFPAALLCYWVSTNAVSLIQVSFLKIPKVRDYFNIEPLINHNPEDLPLSQKKGFKKTMKETWTNMKISKELEARERFDEDLFKRAGRAPIPKTYKYDPTKASSAIQAKQK